MAREIDVRQPLAVDTIRYADGFALAGSEGSDTILVVDGAGNQAPICTKGQIDELVKALRRAQKLWA